jgi:hypothetical protein
MVDSGEFGLGGKAEAGIAEASDVVLADTTTLNNQKRASPMFLLITHRSILPLRDRWLPVCQCLATSL